MVLSPALESLRHFSAVLCLHVVLVFVMEQEPARTIFLLLLMQQFRGLPQNAPGVYPLASYLLRQTRKLSGDPAWSNSGPT